MHISEMIYWPVTAVFFICVFLFVHSMFLSANSIPEYVAEETNSKTLVYQDVSDTSQKGYVKKTILVTGSSILSDVLNTDDSVAIIINNAAGYAGKLSPDERKNMKNKGDTSPVLSRINTARQYTKTYSYDENGTLTTVEYNMN